MSNVLEKLEIPDRVKEILAELIERLKEVLGNDFQLYLFGSYARGDWVEGLSDIDVVVVSPRFRGVSFVERAAMIRKLVDSFIPMEILCYTPEELDELLRENSFLREIATYWIRLC